MCETYCGKTCVECTYKEELNCPGCKTGPGQQFGGDCELARCCRSKGHEACVTCSFSGGCRTLMGKQQIPKNRQRQEMFRKAREAAIDRKAPILAKWLWLLFWLVIPCNLASFMTFDELADAAPVLYWTGSILNVACSLAYGLILLKLADAEEQYQKAATYILISAVVAGGVALFAGITPPKWTLALTVPAATCNQIGLYHECQAHSTALDGLDNALSKKWATLWIWHIGSLCGIFIGLLLMLLLPILGLILVLAALVSILVVSIRRLICLYNSAQLFRARGSDHS